MKRILPTLLILSAFSLPMAYAQSSSQASDYTEKATTLAKQGDYAGALKNYSAAIKAAPTEYAGYLNRAQLYRVLKKTDLAMADFNQAVRISGNDPQVVFERAKMYQDLKKYPQALADVNRSIQSDPNIADRYATRAAIYQAMKQYNRAIVDCTKFLATNPRAGQIYDARGSAFLGLNQLDKAIADYSAAIACNNKDAFGLAMRGRIYEKQKKYDLALADLSRVIVQVPDDSPGKSKYYEQRLKLYKLLNETNEDLIASDLERMAALEPKNTEIRYRFSKMAWRKQPDMAIRCMTEAVALEPHNVQFLALLGKVQADTGKSKQALESLNKALEINSNDADSLASRAQAYLTDYKFAEALADADKSIGLNPSGVEVFYFKGQAEEGLRHSKSAVEAYGKFVALKSQAPNRTNEDNRRIEQAKRKVELLTANLSEAEKAALNVPAQTAPSPAPAATPAVNPPAPEKTPADEKSPATAPKAAPATK
jgi:tetratricopeptide (TPR) repeat protein